MKIAYVYEWSSQCYCNLCRSVCSSVWWRRVFPTTAVPRQHWSVLVCWPQWTQVDHHIRLSGLLNVGTHLLCMCLFSGLLVSHVDGSCGDRIFTTVCLSFFHAISRKPMQLGLPKLKCICSTISPENPFILGSKGKRSCRRASHKNCRCGSLHSCECWLFLVVVVAWFLQVRENWKKSGNLVGQGKCRIA